MAKPMKPITIQRLNTINRLFYQTTATEFDATRGKPWPGWETLVPYIQRDHNGETFSVLDVGCGNGRFGAYMADALKLEIDYHGLDNNEALLKSAETTLRDAPGLAYTLERRDIVLNPPEVGEFDLVAAFGLIHHIPGYANRQTFVRQLAARVRPGGVLAFACWRFYDYDRFRKRLVDWPEDLAPVVEKNDYLLDWRRGDVAWRYCHYVDDAEHDTLVSASGLQEIHRYRADGANNRTNQYSLLRKS